MSTDGIIPLCSTVQKLLLASFERQHKVRTELHFGEDSRFDTGEAQEIGGDIMAVLRPALNGFYIMHSVPQEKSQQIVGPCGQNW